MARFILIGGNPFRGYTGTVTYTSLKVVGKSDDIKVIDKLVKQKWDECGGLMICIDTTTGEEALAGPQPK